MDVDSIRQFLQEHDLFKSLDEVHLDTLLSEFYLIELKPDEVLFEHGDEADSLFIVASGTLKVLIPTETGETVTVNHLHPGDVIGEIAFLTGQKRSATIAADTDSEILGFTRRGFNFLMDNEPAVIEALSQKLRERIQQNQLSNILSRVFGLQISQNITQTIANQVDWLVLPSGTPLFHQNDISDAMYFVVSGLLKQESIMPDGEKKMHREVGPGDTVGLMLMLTGQRQATTVYAIRESVVVRVTQALFEQMTQAIPALALPIMRLLSYAAAGVAPHSNLVALTYVLIPLHSDVPITTFGQELVETLNQWDNTLYLDADQVNQHFSGRDIARTSLDSPMHAALVNWISEQQANHDHVVFITDPEWTNWTQNCMQFADRIILVGTSDSHEGRQPSLLEEAIAQEVPHTRTELVLLHKEATTTPQGTSRWLEHRNVHTYHHVRLGNKRHYRRLARRLSGRAVGLVLSGGGALGFGHIGAIKSSGRNGR